MSREVPTARGLIDSSTLGRTLMHEHVFTLTPDVQQNHNEWHEEERIDDAVRKLSDLKADRRHHGAIPVAQSGRGERLDAAARPRRPRTPTRRTAGSVRRQLEAKRLRSQLKAKRRDPDDDAG